MEPLGLVQTAGDEREEVKGHGVEEDVGVSGRTNADAGACWRLHESSRRRAGVERGEGRGKGRVVEPLESRRSKGDLMVRDYIYDFSLT